MRRSTSTSWQTQRDLIAKSGHDLYAQHHIGKREGDRAHLIHYIDHGTGLSYTEKPNAIVVILGVNDRAPLRERAPPAKEAASSTVV